jgi:formylglycine-generating enzyme required for sulfatase activity/Tol biopolymer transport system component
MYRRTIHASLALLLLLPACTKIEPSGAASGDLVDLQTIQPKSGGEMVLIPEGEFTMGDPKGQPDEAPHTVYVSAFYMDRFPVTQKLFKEVMGTNPSKRQGDELPVERTRWTDAALFCNRCSEIDGLAPCYDPKTWQCDFRANGYRVPTEAEWEYACRAGSQTSYSFGNDVSDLALYAWCKPHSQGRTWPMGEKRPNRWGLYDMHGNVWQWCNDFYGETYYASSPRENPTGPSEGKQRVLRGGAWSSTPEKCRAAYRFKDFPVYSDACFGADSYGFRRVRGTSRDVKPSIPVAHNAEVQPVADDPEPELTAPAVATNPTSAPEQQQLDGAIDLARLSGTIVFASDRSGALDIWKMRASGQNPVQLTNDPYPDADPRFSPDGSQIMYTSLREGFPEVWTIKRDGSDQHRLTAGAQAAWSPDGHSIVFIRDDEAFVRTLASGQEQRVSPGAWQRCGVPTWSPDGRQIALASRHLESIGIFILGLEGSQPRQVQSDEPCCTPQWSHDGTRMIYQTVQGHIQQMELESGTEEQVTFGADVQHDARYSPDSTMIVFCRAPTPEGPWQLSITDLESENLDTIQITHEGSNSLPDWHRVED